MTNMFDKYDRNIPEPAPTYRPPRKKDRLVGSPNVMLLKNIKGEETGVYVKEGSLFDLYFTFDGECEDCSLMELLSEAQFSFMIYDIKHHELVTSEVEVYSEQCFAKVTVASEIGGLLRYGNYYMRLEMIVDGITYTLFDENDGILSIE